MLLPLVSIIILLILANRSDSRQQNLPPLTARDGILEFAVDDVKCGQSALGKPPAQRRAQGQLCTVGLRVRNFGNEARRVYVGSQKLHDKAGRTFSGDNGAWTYLPESAPFFNQEINPGNEVTATLVYDISADAVPQRLEVHDSPLSRGASITL